MSLFWTLFRSTIVKPNRGSMRAWWLDVVPLLLLDCHNLII